MNAIQAVQAGTKGKNGVISTQVTSPGFITLMKGIGLGFGLDAKKFHPYPSTSFYWQLQEAQRPKRIQVGVKAAPGTRARAREARPSEGPRGCFYPYLNPFVGLWPPVGANASRKNCDQ